MIKRHSILTAILLCFVAFTQVMAQEMQEPEPLPIDPKVRYGKLSNGLTYYIRHNDQPKDRADFYIAQNVGSILEEDNQRGLAHFLEHMAFDGSRNFPNNGMDEYIESVGMRSGENFNAYTSFDETVYMITNAPVNKSGVVDSCLLILHDWSGFLALTDSAIQKERGVIREEWRTRQDAQTRLWEQQLPKMYPGSRYANRMPIGSIDVIENFKPDDGYADRAVELLGDHKPAGPLRGNKYSAFEGGTRIPAIVHWPKEIKQAAVSDALVSQIDWFASLASLTNSRLPEGSAPDSYDYLDTWIGKSKEDRPWVIEQALNKALSVRTKDWKYIEPSVGSAIMEYEKIETGYSPEPQLYDMTKVYEEGNKALQHPEIVFQLQGILKGVRDHTIKAK